MFSIENLLKKRMRKKVSLHYAETYIIYIYSIDEYIESIEGLVFDIYFSLMITKMINDLFNLERKQKC